jgi:secreted trypsin-like serine protease
MSLRDFKVVLGSHNLNDTSERGRITPTIAEIKIHPEFNIRSTRNDYDIAVIVLAQSVSETRYVKAINLIDVDSEPEEIRDGIVASYGYKNNRRLTTKSAPKELNTKFLDSLSCLIDYQVMAHASGKNTFCISEESTDRVCIEDIGSGLFVKYEGQFYLRGLLSIVAANDVDICDEKTFAIYTDVEKYTDWIRSVPETLVRSTVNTDTG